MSSLRILKYSLGLCVLALLFATSMLAWNEMQSSSLQAKYFAKLASGFQFKLKSGKSDAIRFPGATPYDERMGYSKIPEFANLLTNHDFVLTEQAAMSSQMLQLPLPPIYREKDQAGLDLYDRDGQELFHSRSPGRVYTSFDTVPSVLVHTLLFIEDRELLETKFPSRNPAINWSRLNRAVFDQVIHLVDPHHETPGASTLVTQIEKYRHSPEGRTSSPKEKLAQMQTASLRSYMGGENTLARRKETVVEYLNTVPLTARSGFGEVNGIGDGMFAWYGRDFDDVNRRLGDKALQTVAGDQLLATASTYKQALSLIIAQRRPSYFLHEGYPQLNKLVDQHLHLLAQARVIPQRLADTALSLKLSRSEAVANETANFYINRKGVSSLRAELSGLLHLQHMYDLDRLDLRVDSTIDNALQTAVTKVLRELKSPEQAKKAALYGKNMLGPNDDPSHITFSFTLFERTNGANLLRAQTDNLDQPFDINNGARLNLGSTAKLRTLITYLEVISALHEKYAGQSSDELAKLAIAKQDNLSGWAVDYLKHKPDSTLGDMLEAAMLRTYSGNPSEVFFTGGGLQQFENFEPEENVKSMTVREGFKHSVNLVFVRLMRDIVHYYGAHVADVEVENLANTEEASRHATLSRFADKEGREFLLRFHHKYEGKSAADAQQQLIDAAHASAKRLVIIFRSLHPNASLADLNAFLENQVPEAQLNHANIETFYHKYDPTQLSLTDRGFLAGVHPLELWLVGYLQQTPNPSVSAMLEASRKERQEVYEWLFKTHNRQTQDSRIQQMLEFEAFQEIAKSWRRLGYPFEALTPSIATSLGASGDRPAALAHLMGLIVNNGLEQVNRKLTRLAFASGTPYETVFQSQNPEPVRLLPQELTTIVRRSLLDVVQGGTGVRLKDGIAQAHGARLEVGGKTGTGDHRFETYSSSGDLISSRAVNRSATFVFLIGDRYFGTMTAYAHEPYAAQYTFTSALSVQLLKSIAPVLQGLTVGHDSANNTIASMTPQSCALGDTSDKECGG